MVKTLAKSIREYKKDSILTPILVSLEVIMEVLIPLMMANLIDYGIDKGNMEHIWKVGVVLLIAAFLSLFFGAAAGKTAAYASAGLAKNLRKDMYYNVQNFSFSNIDKFSTSSLVTRMTTDVTNVQNAYQMIIRTAMRSPLMLIFSLVCAFRVNARLSMIFLLCVPVLGIGLFVIMSKVHPIFRRVFKTYDKLNNVVQENVRGIRVVKSFVREDYERKKFQNISQMIYKDFSKAEKTLAFNMPLMQFCMYGCMLFFSWFGARAIVLSGGSPGSGFTTGELMSLITYVMQVLMSLMMLSMVFVMITMSKASVERIYEVLTEVSDLKDGEDPVMEVPDGSIRFEDVSFSYSDKAHKKCLDHVNLDIRSGETIGIIGGTGSSKSTLVQLIQSSMM